MKTIAWIASLALVAGCSAASGGKDGNGGGRETPTDEPKGTTTNTTTGTQGDLHLPPMGLLPVPDRTTGMIPPGVIGNGGIDPGSSNGEGENDGPTSDPDAGADACDDTSPPT